METQASTHIIFISSVNNSHHMGRKSWKSSGHYQYSVPKKKLKYAHSRWVELKLVLPKRHDIIWEVEQNILTHSLRSIIGRIIEIGIQSYMAAGSNWWAIFIDDILFGLLDSNGFCLKPGMQMLKECL